MDRLFMRMCVQRRSSSQDAFFRCGHHAEAEIPVDFFYSGRPPTVKGRRLWHPANSLLAWQAEGMSVLTGKLQRQEIQINRYPDELCNRIYQPRRGNDAQ
jgi:hypothetical protein